MVAKVKTVVFSGIESISVEVQVSISSGIPSITIVGLVDKSISESKERIKSAILSIGMSLPAKKITINLAPANIIKDGSHLDLPIAIGILIAVDVVNQSSVEGVVILGELSLDGEISYVKGVLSAIAYAKANNLRVICSSSNRHQAEMLCDEVDVFAFGHIFELISHLKGKAVIGKVAIDDIGDDIDDYIGDDCDFGHNASNLEGKIDGTGERNDRIDRNDRNESRNVCRLENIKGQLLAKRALIIAACGNHNIMFCGHPGTGKSMLASALIGILPPLTKQEALEVETIYSFTEKPSAALNGSGFGGGFGAGFGGKLKMVRQRPYRAPHHSASLPAIIGGGRNAKPGEVTLAHCGVLFLDEFGEFPRSVLDSLRQPIESGTVSVARVNSSATYPSCFQLVAAMNPCKCGYFGDVSRQCRKAPHCARDYQKNISGPILDRIDICVDVCNEDSICDESFFLPSSDRGSEGAMTTQEAAEFVAKVRLMQAKRYEDEGASAGAGSGSGAAGFVRCNAQLNGDLLDKYCTLKDKESQDLITKYAKKYGLSMRGYAKLLRVARTIADIENCEDILKPHIAEAIAFRSRNFTQ